MYILLSSKILKEMRKQRCRSLLKIKMQKTLNEIIGQNIRLIRKKHDMTIEQLAELLDLSPGFMRLVESGERCTRLKNLVEFTKIFEITLDGLVAEEEESDGYEEDNMFVIKIRMITIQMQDMDMIELEFISNMIKGLKHIKQKNMMVFKGLESHVPY